MLRDRGGKIVECAQTGTFHLISIGTKGPSDMAALVLGSVALLVVHLGLGRGFLA